MRLATKSEFSLPSKFSARVARENETRTRPSAFKEMESEKKRSVSVRNAFRSRHLLSLRPSAIPSGPRRERASRLTCLRTRETRRGDAAAFVVRAIAVVNPPRNSEGIIADIQHTSRLCHLPTLAMSNDR